MNKSIRTDRLIIVSFFPTARDMALQVKWLNDPDIVRFSEQRHRVHTLESETEYVNSFRPPNMLLALLAGDGYIGSMTVYVDDPNKVAEVGIMIGDKSKWGKGYGFEAWKAVCDYLLDNGMRKVDAGCMSTNTAMVNICRKYRMQLQGIKLDHFLLKDGSTADMLCYTKHKQ